MRTRDQALHEYLYGGPYPRGFPTGLEKQVKRKLQMLKAAHALHDLKVPPGNRRINQQYRLIFQWDDDAKEAYDVYFDDYHH